MTVAAARPITDYAMSPWADRGLSDEASILRGLIRDAAEFPRSIALGEPRRAAREALDAAWIAAQVDDWDGEGARRVDPSTYVYADQFLRLVPTTVAFPDVTVDTDGEVLFEWDEGSRQVFSVSVGRDGTLTYAGLFGHAKVHGTEHLYEALPLVISDCLERLYGQPRP